MSDSLPPSLPVTINNKTVDLGTVPHLLRPFDQWSMGDLKRLEKAGLSLFSRKVGEGDGLTLQEAVALVTYVVGQANPQITATDVDTMDPASWGAIFGTITERLLPQGDKPGPLADGSSNAPTTSDGVSTPSNG